MTNHQTNSAAVSPKSLLWFTLGSALAATILTVFVVLPAEFGRDPTGFGQLSGLIKLSQYEAACE